MYNVSDVADMQKFAEQEIAEQLFAFLAARSPAEERTIAISNDGKCVDHMRPERR
jgi:hypothetical protein